MFNRKKLVGSILLCLAIGVVTAMAQQQNPVDQPAPGWKDVDDAIKQGLPKTAIEKLTPLIESALADKDYDEATKAIALRIVLEANIQGNRPEEKITRMKTEIAKAPEPMKPVLEAILANWYWHYFQQNRWQFGNRTQVDETTSEDFTTWDLKRILSEIDSQFDKAFTGSKTLKTSPVAEYSQILDPGTAPALYRPTMFDVLAHNALEFYSAGEQAGAKVQDAFELRADSPIFASREDFVAWQPTTSDESSPILRAVQLYQELLAFHADDEDNSALLDADLYRLEFGDSHSVGEEKRERFKAALRRFEQANIKHEISTRALHLLAEQIHADGELVEAHKLAEQAIARFPGSVGANACHNLIRRIEAPSANASTERVWNAPWPTIDVRYRNLDKIYFRLVTFDFDEYIRSDRWNVEYMDDAMRDRLLQQAPVKAWSAELPKTPDYKERTERLAIPDGLVPGSYFLISSTDENFSQRDQYRQMTEVWVSDLALVMRTDVGSGFVEGMLLDAKSGKPIAGATIRGFNSFQRQRREMPAKTTDENGVFRFEETSRQGVLVLASHDGHSLSTSDLMHSYKSNPSEKPNTQTRFFTDRAIYRPGQTIYYKGICISSHVLPSSYKTLDRQKVTVVFSDPNGKEIERVEHVTNKYGSFSGSVTAPRDRVTGQMTIHVESGPGGQTSIQVEEYKRPKFRVTLESPKEAAKLGAEVSVTGTATAYTGVSISDASVQWRVVREVQYPFWWYWSRWSMPRGNDSQEIAHGEATTSSNGTFDVTFIAKPDDSVDPLSEPTFRYTVYADVTDTTGETRSDERSVQLGFTALKASMTADEWLTTQDETKITIRTSTIDDENLSAKGIVKIYKLKQPATVMRSAMTTWSEPFNGLSADDATDNADAVPTSSNPNDWPLGEVAYETEFETNGAGVASVQGKLAAGVYRAVLQSRDSFGKEVKAILPLQVIDPNADKLDVKVPNLVKVKNRSLEPGETLEMIWGTGYETAQAYVEVEHDGKLLQSYWTRPNQTQTLIRQEVTESMRGGFTVRVTMVRENRAYLTTQSIDVPWSNKDLMIKWERFTSKLTPGQKETWTAVISGKDAKRAVAEMVATLYDASLDAFAMHDWISGFGVFRQDNSRVQLRFQNQAARIQIPISYNYGYLNEGIAYPRLSSQIVTNLWGYGFFNDRMMRKGMRGMPVPMAAMAMSDGIVMGGMGEADEFADAAPMAAEAELSLGEPASDKSSASKLDLSNVTARTNLNETAFFFPNLISGDDGTVRVEFTLPEALTEWRFLGFAHDPELRAGLLTDTVVTSKDLMVQPNPPRFLREGDVIEFTTKVSNRSATNQTGTVRLTLADANSTESVDAKLGNTQSDQDFSLNAGESKSFSWRLSVPEGIGFLTYKAIASSGRLSDGEEGFLPVLSKRILVTESIPLPIRGKQTKHFDFAKLLASGDSKTLKHESLTVQMVSNPSWYAVLALPYLMEYPYECNEQTFNRMYANALARHIVTSDPKIERVFAQWRGTPALDSPLAKNQDLKSVMLEETPWYAEAQDESQTRRNVGILFDQNRLESEIARAMAKLAESQREDGAWSWFPGGPKNDYMTLYITTGFGRLRHLGVNIDAEPAINAVSSLDEWATEIYSNIKDHDPEKNHLSSTIALYLYGRSFFLADQPIADEHREAINYWLDQAKRHWLKLAVRQSQAHLAIAQKRFGDEASAKTIVDSIRERSVSDEELGMFWRENELAWFWYHAPIESQAMMIEMFDEVAGDAEAVEACKVWLLKQKQTQDWKTTKATGDAVYALLLRGSNLLASSELVKVSLAGETIQPTNVEADTGFYQEKFTRGEVKPSMGSIVVTKLDEGVAWGSVHWQYLEDISAVTAHEGTPLTLSKQLFTKKNTAQGPTLTRVDGPIAVGDELVVRIVLKTDRDMEYVHMKDHRGSGTEPVNVLSQYKYQDGLAYYESTRDTASHFFIDYLPKGTYVFEYSTRVQLKGEYQTGVASIECMYAPEFNSHSESLELSVE